MERKCMVYGYRNKIEDKWYIGECYEDRERARQNAHKSAMKKCEITGKKYGCYKFCLNVIKYTFKKFEEVFEYVVLEKGISLNDIYKREEYWSSVFDSIKNGYNERVGTGTKEYIGDSIKGDNHHKAIPLVTYETKPVAREHFFRACRIRGEEPDNFIELLCDPIFWEKYNNREGYTKTFNYIHKDKYDGNIHKEYDRSKVNFREKSLDRFEFKPSLKDVFINCCKSHNENSNDYIDILAEKDNWYKDPNEKIGYRRTFYFIHKNKYDPKLHKDKERREYANMRDIDEYENIPSKRDDFKKICKKRKWDFNSFEETLCDISLWKEEFNYLRNKIYLRKQYFYKLKIVND